jgi:DNA-binding NtrC family response regulator
LILVDEALQSTPIETILDALQAAGASSHTLLLTPAPAAERAASQLKRGIKDIALKPYTAPELFSLL